jgi:hypothetical protein
VAVLGFGIRVGSPKFRVGNGKMTDVQVQVQNRFFYGAAYTVRDQQCITKRTVLNRVRTVKKNSFKVAFKNLSVTNVL